MFASIGRDSFLNLFFSACLLKEETSIPNISQTSWSKNRLRTPMWMFSRREVISM